MFYYFKVNVINFQNTMYGSTNPETQISPEVQQWFSTVDRDGSGKITAIELKSALANGQGGTFSDTACRLMIGILYYILYYVFLKFIIVYQTIFLYRNV